MTVFLFIALIVLFPFFKQADSQDSLKEERMRWLHEAKFGMFIHWGPYAQFAGSYNNEQQGG